MTEQKWLIVWCSDDRSHSLISETQAIFDEGTLTVGDELIFVYNKKEYKGIVKEMGDDDDYDRLATRLEELNAERTSKKEDSFDDNRPRKSRAKGKLKDATQTLLPATRIAKVSKRSSPNTSNDESKRKKHHFSPLAALLNEENEEDEIINDAIDKFQSPSSSPTPEERPLEHKMIAKKSLLKGKNDDLKRLKSIKGPSSSRDHEINIPMNASASAILRQKSSETESTSKDESIKPKRQNSAIMCMDSEDDEVNSVKAHQVYLDSDIEAEFDEQSEEDVTKKSKKIKNKKRAKDSMGEEQPEEAQDDHPIKNSMFRQKKEDSDVIEVCGRSKELAHKKFYVSSGNLTAAKAAPNASQFAKAMLIGIFSDRALLECSVSGGQYRAGGKANFCRKPALDQDAIAVIIDVTLHRQKKKKWNPEQNKREIASALRQKLVDVRPRLTKLFSN